MGGIDLDPASCSVANQVVRAARFYSLENDGLSSSSVWGGRVFLNPPYGSSLIRKFSERLISELAAGNVSQAVWLSNNATETRWARGLLSSCSVVCLPSGRVRFLDSSLQPAKAPLQGSNGYRIWS